MVRQSARLRLATTLLIGTALWVGFLEPVPNAQTPESRPPLGLQFRLSEGTIEHAPPATPAIDDSVPLSVEDARAILNRLPPLETDKPLEQDWPSREPTVHPPPSGTVVLEAFPPADQPVSPIAAAAASLKILRVSPIGEVAAAAHLS